MCVCVCVFPWQYNNYCLTVEPGPDVGGSQRLNNSYLNVRAHKRQTLADSFEGEESWKRRAFSFPKQYISMSHTCVATQKIYSMSPFLRLKWAALLSRCRGANHNEVDEAIGSRENEEWRTYLLHSEALTRSLSTNTDQLGKFAPAHLSGCNGQMTCETILISCPA